MAEKMSMDIIIKDMKEQDAHIEADVQTYAALLGNVEKHTAELNKRTEEKELFEQMLYKIGGERDFSGDSVHIKTLEERVSAQEREIADNNKLIEEQKDYYEALRKKDYQTLWEQKEDKSAMAAICFAFERWSGTSAELAAKLMETRKELSEKIARYLLIKALVYSENKQEADDISEETDRLLSGILGRTDFPQSDAVWQNIETFLRIRKTQRTMVRCKSVLQAQQEQKDRFEAFEQDYADNCNEIQTEIRNLERQKIGKEVEAAVKRTKEWFSEQTAGLENRIKRRRSEAAVIEAHLQALQGIHTELEGGMESGLALERCDAICDSIRTMESENAEIVDVKALDQERKQMLREYRGHLKTIGGAKDADIERATENQRQRVRAKKERNRRFRKLMLVMGIILAICQIPYIESSVVHGIGTYMPNVCRRHLTIYDTSVPYHVSLLPLDSLEIQRTADNLSTIITPFGTRMLQIDTAMTNVNIHGGTEEVRLNCEKLEELSFPDSVTKLVLYNLKDELAETLELPEHLESLDIHGSPDLTDAGFQSLEIPETVTHLTIRCDGLKNINISKYLEECDISDIENLTVNGDVQTLNIHYVADVTVNGDVQTLNMTSYSDVADITINGNVQALNAAYEVDLITVNGNVQSLHGHGKVNNVILNGIIDFMSVEHCDYIEFGEAPRALSLGWYDNEDELILPEGIEILELTANNIENLTIPDSVKYLDIDIHSDNTHDFDELILPEGIEILELNANNIENLTIPDSVKYLDIYISSDNTPDLDTVNIPEGVKYLNIYIHSYNTPDFDTVNIPEGILYYRLSSREHDDDRQYQAKNCPQELLEFNFDWEEDNEIPDFSGY